MSEQQPFYDGAGPVVRLGYLMMGLKRYHWWNQWMFSLGVKLTWRHTHRKMYGED